MTLTETHLSAVEAGVAAPSPRLVADFFGFQARLSPAEQAAALRVRTFLEAEVRPIADDYWSRAEFPRHLVPSLARLGLFGAFVPEVILLGRSACEAVDERQHRAACIVDAGKLARDVA